TQVGKDGRVHQLGDLLLPQLQFAFRDRLLDAGEDDASDADRGGEARGVGPPRLRAALIEQVDETIEGLEEQLLGALARVLDLDGGETGDAFVSAQEAQ